MPRHRLQAKDAAAISRRLKELASHRYKSMAALVQAYKIFPRTAKGWARRVKPSVPDLPFLVKLAREERISLDWLLLGEGDMLRPEHEEVTTPYGHMLSLLEIELRKSEKATKREATQAWAQMAVYRTESSGFDAILDLAVEGVRPLYRSILLQHRVFDLASRMFGGWADAWQKGEDVDEGELRRRAEEYSKKMSQKIKRMVGDTIALSGRKYTRGSGGSGDGTPQKR